MKKTLSKAFAGGGLVVFLAAALLFSQAAFARQGKGHERKGPHGPDPEYRAKMLGIVLDLTEAQESAVLKILQDEQKEIQAAREKHKDQGPENRGQAHEEFMAIHQKYSDLVAGQLTEPQAEKYWKLEDLRREQMQRHKNREGKGKRNQK